MAGLSEIRIWIDVFKLLNAEESDQSMFYRDLNTKARKWFEKVIFAGYRWGIVTIPIKEMAKTYRFFPANQCLANTKHIHQIELQVVNKIWFAL